MKRYVVKILSSFVAFAWWPIVGFHELSGAEYRAGERPVIDADVIIEDDLYMFGDELTVDGTVKGDLVAFGRLIRMNGSVEGDLIASGQSIVINGEVGDDVRMAGQVLKIDEGAAITDDVIAAGFSLEIVDGSSVGGDVVYAGYQAQLSGDVGGKVNGAMANCEVSGKVVGDVDLTVGGDEAGAQMYTFGSEPPISFPDVPPGLTIHDAVQIGGELEYESPEEGDIAAGAQITGGISHKLPRTQQTEPPTLAERALSAHGRFTALLIVGLCVVLVAPTWTRSMSDTIKTRPLASFGLGVVGTVGFIVFVLVVLLAMMLLATLAGLAKVTGLVPVIMVLGLSCGAMLVISFWFFTSYLAEIVLSFLAGSWLLGLVKSTPVENRFLSFLAGLVLLALICSVPYLGTIASWFIILLGLGALVQWMFWKRAPEPASVEQP